MYIYVTDIAIIWLFYMIMPYEISVPISIVAVFTIVTAIVLYVALFILCTIFEMVNALGRTINELIVPPIGAWHALSMYMYDCKELIGCVFICMIVSMMCIDC